MALNVLTFDRAARALTACAVQFSTLTDSVDTTTSMGRFTLHCPAH